VVNILWSYNFIKPKHLDKHLLFFMLFTICTMVNSTNFTYLGSWKQLLKMLSQGATFKKFNSKGGTIHFAIFDFIVSLKMFFLQSRSLALKSFYSLSYFAHPPCGFWHSRKLLQ
jgi:hypothetical protein